MPKTKNTELRVLTQADIGNVRVKWQTVQQLAAELKVTTSTIYSWIKQNKVYAGTYLGIMLVAKIDETTRRKK